MFVCFLVLTSSFFSFACWNLRENYVYSYFLSAGFIGIRVCSDESGWQNVNWSCHCFSTRTQTSSYASWVRWHHFLSSCQLFLLKLIHSCFILIWNNILSVYLMIMHFTLFFQPIYAMCCFDWVQGIIYQGISNLKYDVDVQRKICTLYILYQCYLYFNSDSSTLAPLNYRIFVYVFDYVCEHPLKKYVTQKLKFLTPSPNVTLCDLSH